MCFEFQGQIKDFCVGGSVDMRDVQFNAEVYSTSFVLSTKLKISEHFLQVNQYLNFRGEPGSFEPI